MLNLRHLFLLMLIAFIGTSCEDDSKQPPIRSVTTDPMPLLYLAAHEQFAKESFQLAENLASLVDSTLLDGTDGDLAQFIKMQDKIPKLVKGDLSDNVREQLRGYNNSISQLAGIKCEGAKRRPPFPCGPDSYDFFLNGASQLTIDKKEDDIILINEAGNIVGKTVGEGVEAPNGRFVKQLEFTKDVPTGPGKLRLQRDGLQVIDVLVDFGPR